MNNDRLVQTRVDAVLERKIQKLAKQQRISVADLVRQALASYVEADPLEEKVSDLAYRVRQIEDQLGRVR